MDMTKYAGSESKYLKASDLQGKRVRVTISGVELVEFRDDETGKVTHKPSLSLKNKEKKLTLNATNTEEIIRAFGAESEGWSGKDLQLSTKYYKAFDREGIVVTPIVPEADDPNDDIPF